MNNLFWKRVDNVIIALNKMESLCSLGLMVTGTTGFISQKHFWFITSFVLIIIIGVIALLFLILYFWKRVNDQNFVRSFYVSEGKQIKSKFNGEYRIKFVTSRKPESVYIELEKEQMIYPILKLRQDFSYRYTKKMLDDIYDEFNRDK